MDGEEKEHCRQSNECSWFSQEAPTGLSSPSGTNWVSLMPQEVHAGYSCSQSADMINNTSARVLGRSMISVVIAPKDFTFSFISEPCLLKTKSFFLSIILTCLRTPRRRSRAASLVCMCTGARSASHSQPCAQTLPFPKHTVLCTVSKPNAKHPRTASFMLTYTIIAFMYISRNGNVKSKDPNVFAT